MYKSGSEAAQSDGEESVDTAEVDLLDPTQEIHLEEPAWMLRGEIEDDEESIRELHEERYKYGLEEEEHESSLSLVHRVGVYIAPATQINPGSVSATATGTAEVLAQNQQNQQTQQNQLTVLNPVHVGIDGEIASGSSGSAVAACRTDQFGFMLNRSTEENTAAPSNLAPFSVNLVFDPAILEAAITPENAIIWAKELDTARCLRAIAKGISSRERTGLGQTERIG